MCQGFCDHVKLQADMAMFFLTCVLFLTDTPLAYWKDQEQMRFLLRMSCALVLLRWLQNFQLAILAGYRYSVGGTTYISPCESCENSLLFRSKASMDSGDLSKRC